MTYSVVILLIIILIIFFFFNDTATTEIYTLSLHDALPILRTASRLARRKTASRSGATSPAAVKNISLRKLSIRRARPRSEEHTSELQSRQYLVCRLLLEKKKETQWLERLVRAPAGRAHRTL